MSGSSIGLALPPKAPDVIGFEQRSGLVNIKRRELTALAERHQIETVWPLRRRRLQQQPHRTFDQPADARAGFRGALLQPLQKTII